MPFDAFEIDNLLPASARLAPPPRVDATLALLVGARARIARGWAIGIRGLTSEGENCLGQDPRAVAWCALGALDAELGRYADASEAVRLLSAALPPSFESVAYPSGAVAHFNNTHTKEDVLGLFDRAIAAREAAQNALRLRVLRTLRAFAYRARGRCVAAPRTRASHR